VTGIIATAETEITASPARVWSAFTDPAQIKRYMFGSEVETDWEPGGTIVWKGEYQGRAYQDKGRVVEVEPERRLVLTHFSPLSGQDDVPENYHTLTYVLEPGGGGTMCHSARTTTLVKKRRRIRGITGRRCCPG